MAVTALYHRCNSNSSHLNNPRGSLVFRCSLIARREHNTVSLQSPLVAHGVAVVNAPMRFIGAAPAAINAEELDINFSIKISGLPRVPHACPGQRTKALVVIPLRSTPLKMLAL